VNVREESGQIVLRKQVSTRGNAVREFLAQLHERSGEGYAAIVEVCGFNDWLLDLLPRCGCREIVLIQPGEPGKRKTDHRDANQLCEVLWVNRHRLLHGQRVQGVRRVNIPSPRERDDRRLAGTRQRIGRELTRAIPVGQLVMHVLKQDGRLRSWYLGIKRRRGAKIGRVAVMRRLTTILWHMLTHRQAYCRGGVSRKTIEVR
jgi:hypothetical protein